VCPTKKLLTIIVASNRPHQMKGFLENLSQTVKDHTTIEVLVKIDIGDTTMQALMDEAIITCPFDVRYIQTPRLDGYYTLHIGYQQLFLQSNPETYFIFPVNEEVRFKTKGWDLILADYIKFFPDDLFRLKISRLKFRNYYTHHDCGPTPENYPFFSRKWMELAGGVGDCWGPDGWHQFVDYHLGQTEGIDSISGHFRSVPIHDIQIEGEEAGKELTKEQIKIRTLRICQEWWRMYSIKAQQEFRRIAQQMAVYIWAKHKKIENFSIMENKKQKYFWIEDHDRHERYEKVFYYHLSSTYICLENFSFLIKMARRNSLGFLKAYILPSHGQNKGLMKWSNRVVRSNIVLIAIFLSFFISKNETVPKRWMMRLFVRTRSLIEICLDKVAQWTKNK
jgi:hypothetical protein